MTTITIAFLSNQHDIKYLETTYAKRAGTSKFHFLRDAYRYILQVVRMVMYFNPLKVLMPPALWLLAIGFAKGLVDMVRHPFYFPASTVLLVVSGMLIASLALLSPTSSCDRAPTRSDPGRRMAGTSALRLAVVGPTHPYKGGVAAHTTTLAHELSEAGHDVVLVSWSRLFPELLYPGERAVPVGTPDVPPFPRTVRALSWARPDILGPDRSASA